MGVCHLDRQKGLGVALVLLVHRQYRKQCGPLFAIGSPKPRKEMSCTLRVEYLVPFWDYMFSGNSCVAYELCTWLKYMSTNVTEWELYRCNPWKCGDVEPGL
jgi:hypothetical protein